MRHTPTIFIICFLTRGQIRFKWHRFRLGLYHDFRFGLPDRRDVGATSENGLQLHGASQTRGKITEIDRKVGNSFAQCDTYLTEATGCVPSPCVRYTLHNTIICTFCTSWKINTAQLYIQFPCNWFDSRRKVKLFILTLC